MSRLLSIKTGYNCIGEYFTQTRNRSWPWLDKICQKLPQNANILDVGCGNGRLLLSLSQKTKYTGIDFSEVLLDKAKKAHPNHKFILADFTREKTWRNLGQFDAIFFIASLHHLQHKEETVRTLKLALRHLSSKGIIVISVWNLWQPRFLRYHLASWQQKLKDFHYVHIPFQKDWLRFCYAYLPSEWREICHKLGVKEYKVILLDQSGRKRGIFSASNIVITLNK